MTKTAEVISTRTDELKFVARSLFRLASAFGETGNQVVSEKLEALADRCADAAEEIHHEYFAEVNVNVEQSIANSQRFIGSVFKGLLEGKEPKDACLGGVHHHLDRDLIEQRETDLA